jgi:hypothetical protein
LRGKCTCASFVNNNNNNNNDEIGSSDSLYRSDDFGQQQHHGSTNDLNLSNIQPFNNNPSLPNTQRFRSDFIKK